MTEGLYFHLKIDTNTGVFLQILQNFEERLFYRRPVHYAFLILFDDR